MRQNKTEVITIRLTPRIRDLARAAAEREGRFYTNYIAWILEKEVTKNGYKRKSKRRD